MSMRVPTRLWISVLVLIKGTPDLNKLTMFLLKGQFV